MGRQTKLKRKPFLAEKGIQNKSVAITATSDGTGTGVIPASTGFATVTSASANYFVTLPAPVVGTVLYVYTAATGFKLQTSAPATVSINGGTGAAASSAITADYLTKCVCASATKWVCNQFDADGDETKLTAAA